MKKNTLIIAIICSIFILSHCTSVNNNENNIEGSAGSSFTPEPSDSVISDGGMFGDKDYENISTDETMAKEDKREDETSSSLSALTAAADPESSISESSSSGKSRPDNSGLRAGFEDDNRQFNYFLGFLEKFSRVPHFNLDISERIILKIEDKNGNSLPNTEIIIKTGSKTLNKGKSLPDGTFQFNPSMYSNSTDTYTAFISPENMNRKKLTIDRNGSRELVIQFDSERTITEPIPVDIVFVMDTTGSMGEEIDRLKLTIELIHLNLSNLPNDVELRFGMVLYKDREDVYLTEQIPLTTDLEQFQEDLSKVTAEGGGDFPEDLQYALEETILKMDWNMEPNAIKLSFIITDAPPHLDYLDQKYRYTNAVQDARKMGIKIHSIGTGGLTVEGEYILRQIAQFTGGRYIFLTYGEGGESSGGTAGGVSHHTGANFQTDKFEAIIIRFAKEEISHLSSTPLPKDDPFFEARQIEEEAKEETLKKLFNMAVNQLLSFSTIKIEKSSTIAVLPVNDESGTPENAEYFSAQLYLSAANADKFTLVERADLNVILEELSLQLSGITDSDNVEEIGNLLNANFLISASMYEKKGKYEIFLKLLRVSTGEVLSVTKVKIEKDLGL